MATIRGMSFHWTFVAFDQATVQINFGRTGAVARTALSGVTVGALTGISQFRTRADPNGPEQDTNFDFDFRFGWPPIVAQDNMTSVTAQLIARGVNLGGISQGSLMTLTVDLWG
jgi:hypothetical protein